MHAKPNRDIMNMVGRKEGLQELRETGFFIHRTFLVIKHYLLDICP